MRFRPDLALCLLLFLLASTGLAQAQQVRVKIDLTDAPRHIIHVTETLPAHPGINTYSYPQWIPGLHMSGGPIDNLTGLIFHAGGLTGPVIPWRRDLVDMYAFHVNAPSGVHSLSVSFDLLAVASRFDTSPGNHMNAHVAMLETSDVVLYPSGIPSRSILVSATVHLPQAWRSATALRTADQAGPTLQGQDTTYATVSLDQFVDSPILSGDHCRQYPLAPEIQPTHTLDVCAEKTDELDLAPAVLEPMNALVRQTTRLFVGHHYRHFDFLVALGQHLEGNSLEHGQSSDNIVQSFDLKEPANAEVFGYLLPHEYLHSWCGKYRRPASLTTPDFHTPMRDDMLWAYEGLTEYYGFVVSVRAGLSHAEGGLDEFIHDTATLDRPGRTWRSLQDTADAASILRGNSPIGAHWRRSQDYYGEGALLWLEADMKIRELTQGRRTLDDFATAFLGSRPDGRPGDTSPGVLPYTSADVVKTLDTIVPYDWAGFWNRRLTELVPTPPMAGFVAAGYDYVYSPTPTSAEQAVLAKSHTAELYHSLGTSITAAGAVRDVWRQSPAFAAGLVAGDKVLTVEGKPYSTDDINGAIARAARTTQPIELTVERDGEKQTVRIDYHGGLKYPNYVRNHHPDILTTSIFKAK